MYPERKAWCCWNFKTRICCQNFFKSGMNKKFISFVDMRSQNKNENIFFWKVQNRLYDLRFDNRIEQLIIWLVPPSLCHARLQGGPHARHELRSSISKLYIFIFILSYVFLRVWGILIFLIYKFIKLILNKRFNLFNKFFILEFYRMLIFSIFRNF